MFTGVYRVFVIITEKPYTPQRERLCMLWGNPVIFTDRRENPRILGLFYDVQPTFFTKKIDTHFWPVYGYTGIRRCRYLRAK